MDFAFVQESVVIQRRNPDGTWSVVAQCRIRTESSARVKAWVNGWEDVKVDDVISFSDNDRYFVSDVRPNTLATVEVFLRDVLA